jgi:hypothetical protein
MVSGGRRIPAHSRRDTLRQAMVTGGGIVHRGSPAQCTNELNQTKSLRQRLQGYGSTSRVDTKPIIDHIQAPDYPTQVEQEAWMRVS